MRALAALYVVIHHASLQIPRDHLAQNWLLPYFAYGRHAVDVFIVLSGYCLMLPVARNNGYLRTDYLMFIRHRFRRIVPPYLLSLALSLLLIATCIGQPTTTHWTICLPVTSWDIVSHLLLIHDLTGSAYKINHSLWSIAVEWRIYLFFPLLVLGFRRWSGSGTTLVTVALSAVLWFVLWQHPVEGISQEACLDYFGLFALGMLAAHLAFSSEQLFGMHPRKGPWYELATGFLALNIWLTPQTGTFTLLPVDLSLGAATAFLLVGLSRRTGSWFKSLLSWDPLVYVGQFSYSIYLIHAPLLQVIELYLIRPLGLTPAGASLFYAFVGTPLVVALAYGFYLLGERPFMTTRQKKPTTRFPGEEPLLRTSQDGVSIR